MTIHLTLVRSQSKDLLSDIVGDGFPHNWVSDSATLTETTQVYDLAKFKLTLHWIKYYLSTKFGIRIPCDNNLTLNGSESILISSLPVLGSAVDPRYKCTSVFEIV